MCVKRRNLPRRNTSLPCLECRLKARNGMRDYIYNRLHLVIDSGAQVSLFGLCSRRIWHKKSMSSGDYLCKLQGSRDKVIAYLRY